MANTALKQFDKRRARVRRTLKARAEGRPRLSVHRSSKHIYAQIIDDTDGKTLASASSLEKDLRSSLKTGADKAAAAAIGKLVAERALKAGVKVGDVITSIAGIQENLNESKLLARLANETKRGQEVEVTLLRNGKKQRTKIRLQ